MAFSIVFRTHSYVNRAASKQNRLPRLHYHLEYSNKRFIIYLIRYDLTLNILHPVPANIFWVSLYNIEFSFSETLNTAHKYIDGYAMINKIQTLKTVRSNDHDCPEYAASGTLAGTIGTSHKELRLK